MSVTRLNFLHFDMDAFFAAVEIIDRPALKGLPLVVGGNHRKGIVTTASYEARKYGIHSAMPIFMAKSLCKDLVVVPVRHKRYQEVSREVFKLLSSYPVLVEKRSIDEAFIDLSNIQGDPVDFAQNLRKKIYTNTGLTISVGISYNKSLAKMASDWNKPNGIKIITPEDVPKILLPLNIEKVHGIGKRTAEKLHALNVYKIRDLMEVPQNVLEYHFGTHGKEIYQRIRGIDNREISAHAKRKSFGTEQTFSHDISNKQILDKKLYTYAKEIIDELNKKHLLFRTLHLKIKYSNFETITRSFTLSEHSNEFLELYHKASFLLRNTKLERSVRLLGLTVSNFIPDTQYQLNFFSY